MKGRRGRDLRPQLGGICCDRTKLRSKLPGSQRRGTRRAPQLTSPHGRHHRTRLWGGRLQMCLPETHVLRASGGWGPAQGGSTLPASQLGSRRLWWPHWCVQHKRDLHTLPLGHQACRSPNFCPKHTSGIHLAGLLSDSHLTLQTAPEKLLSVSNG